MGAAIYAIHLSGTILFENCSFEENTAVTQNRVLIGAGAAMVISGSNETFAISKNNIYFFNEIEYVGKKQILYYTIFETHFFYIIYL